MNMYGKHSSLAIKSASMQTQHSIQSKRARKRTRNTHREFRQKKEKKSIPMRNAYIRITTPHSNTLI